jgi:hypothetical protein
MGDTGAYEVAFFFQVFKPWKQSVDLGIDESFAQAQAGEGARGFVEVFT